MEFLVKKILENIDGKVMLNKESILALGSSEGDNVLVKGFTETLATVELNEDLEANEIILGLDIADSASVLEGDLLEAYRMADIPTASEVILRIEKNSDLAKFNEKEYGKTLCNKVLKEGEKISVIDVKAFVQELWRENLPLEVAKIDEKTSIRTVSGEYKKINLYLVCDITEEKLEETKELIDLILNSSPLRSIIEEMTVFFYDGNDLIELQLPYLPVEGSKPVNLLLERLVK
ncbi:MAG: hypothetical protein ACE5K4_10485 [Candidatus Hydrothermarchaeota archaeon]